MGQTSPHHPAATAASPSPRGLFPVVKQKRTQVAWEGSTVGNCEAFSPAPAHTSDRELLGCDLKYWEMTISGARLRYLGPSQG